MLGFGCMCIRLVCRFYAGCYGGFCVAVFGVCGVWCVVGLVVCLLMVFIVAVEASCL